MKKAALIIAALAVLACTEEEPQKPKDSIVITSSKTVKAEVTGGKETVSFTASSTWSANPSVSWISVSPASGLKEVGFTELTIDENYGYNPRNGYVAFSSGSATDTVFVSQACADYLDVDPAEFRVGSGGGVYFSKVKTNLDCSVKVEDGAASWITVDAPGTKAVSEITLTITVSSLDDMRGREGKILVSTLSQSSQINIIQSGKEPEFTVADRQSPAAGETFSVPVSANIEVNASAPGWITATRTATGFDFTVSANNTDAFRSAKVIISNAEFGKSASFTVSQKSSKSMYILAIGNSFSVDAMQYLHQILQEMGYKDIFLGNLYIGGCTLQTHANNISSNAGAYEYRKDTTGSWSTTNGFSAIAAMKEREWDYVSMQQASGYSGMPDSYEPYLTTIVNAVKQYCPNAKRMWHMTWAYQGNSTHSDFAKYNKNQMTMYNAILNAVQTKVVSRGDFDFVIPCGTAVQNLRTSFLGDNITRDGYHMSYDNGRYLTGLMWARKITDKSIAGITYTPSSYSYSEKQIAAIKEAVENAYNKPYEVTESIYPPVPIVTGDAEAIISSQGYDPANYSSIDLGLTHNGFYNSTKSDPTAISTGASNSSQFAATKIFSKSEIPNGSLIVLRYGFQYRPEGWTSLSTLNSSSDRPGNVVAASDNSVVEVSDSWWGKWNYRAFNIAKAGNPSLDAAGQAELDDCFYIFVPKQ